MGISGLMHRGVVDINWLMHTVACSQRIVAACPSLGGQEKVGET